MKSHLGCFLIVAALSFESGPLSAADHRVEPLNETPPTDAVAPAIAELLNSTGFKVLRGESRTVCHIWLCKQWDTASGERPAAGITIKNKIRKVKEYAAAFVSARRLNYNDAQEGEHD